MWITTLPVAAALVLSNSDFVHSIRHRLGLPYAPTNLPGVDCPCGQHIPRGDPDHPMSCKTSAGERNVRHNQVANTVRRICHRAGIATSSEPPLRHLRRNTAPHQRDRDGDRGDILIILPRATVTDIAVVHPAAPSHRAVAAVTPGATARAKDTDKIRHYRRNDNNAYDFIPFTVESFGRLSPKAMELLNTLATAAAGASDVEKGDFVTNALREISVALCRGNARVYRHGEAAFARVSGVAIVPGASCPTAEVH